MPSVRRWCGEHSVDPASAATPLLETWRSQLVGRTQGVIPALCCKGLSGNALHRDAAR